MRNFSARPKNAKGEGGISPPEEVGLQESGGKNPFLPPLAFFPRAEKFFIHLRVIKPRHRAAIEPECARRDHQVAPWSEELRLAVSSMSCGFSANRSRIEGW